MSRLSSIVFSSKYNTWSYRQGFYQYNKKKIKNQYAPLICKLIDIPVANKEFAKDIGADWDPTEKKWVIFIKYDNIINK
tara:strand:- start:539 stop:775 length:237 start_codon:yes stop_codon:yes gene_type:complete